MHGLRVVSKGLHMVNDATLAGGKHPTAWLAAGNSRRPMIATGS